MPEIEKVSDVVGWLEDEATHLLMEQGIKVEKVFTGLRDDMPQGTLMRVVRQRYEGDKRVLLVLAPSLYWKGGVT